jgi:hypothetical protein
MDNQEKAFRTLSALAETALSSNAGEVHLILRDATNTPYMSIIVTNGAEETQEILKAVDGVVKEWHATPTDEASDDGWKVCGFQLAMKGGAE